MIVLIIGYILIGIAVSGLVNCIPAVRENEALIKQKYKDQAFGYNLGAFFGFVISTAVWPIPVLLLTLCFIIGFIRAALGLLK